MEHTAAVSRSERLKDTQFKKLGIGPLKKG